MGKPPLKGVMLGAGFFAQFQAEAWNRIDTADIVAIADPLPGRAEAFAREHRIPRWYTDPAAMLGTEHADFADIVTRPESHRELTELASRHCRAVICQKPMAPSYDECEGMVRHCADRGVRLLIHENWRWQPWYREAHRLLTAGSLGRVFHLSFVMRTGDGRGPQPYQPQPYFREMERLLIYETAVHFLDTFRFLGGEFTSVYSRTNRVNAAIRGEDYALIQVAFSSGAAGLIDANRISGAYPPPIAFGEFRIEGECAMLRIAPDGALYCTAYGQPEKLHRPASQASGYKGDSVKALQEHFAQCLLSGDQAESEAGQYLKTVQAVDACYRSAQTGMAVNLG
jgi:predicted dehydrogenase